MAMTCLARMTKRRTWSAAEVGNILASHGSRRLWPAKFGAYTVRPCEAGLGIWSGGALAYMGGQFACAVWLADAFKKVNPRLAAMCMDGCG